MSARDTLVSWIRRRVHYARAGEILDLVDAVVAEEREACAAIADRVEREVGNSCDPAANTAYAIAAEIRGRAK